ncbi:MAG: DUF1949 domain-containing protein, partial [Microbacteriaceae bacterium]|nr:DUF1949 domain-containing protein [Burkholderiaceae bacterium]
GGIKLGAGGLVRAYTVAVAQARLVADKLPLVRPVTLQCVGPYALEGWLRRELEAAGATLLQVRHGDHVEVEFSLAEALCTALIGRINDAGQGRVGWMG